MPIFFSLQSRKNTICLLFSRSNLVEAAAILGCEPPASVEGERFATVNEYLAGLDVMIKGVRAKL